ncbi:uncharacterized protein LOC113229743 [Hyposmocoma kahamanoa]|uniref:uncharacterized protein LOC113229743 n=1 Tax=Hyposmocoma kahamanoa TaxID=1477025 RepID=UPI000E6D915D|nr:uncharacterized protein LOC113229743 [Hyposmocoma kahamanoa]
MLNEWLHRREEEVHTEGLQQGRLLAIGISNPYPPGPYIDITGPLRLGEGTDDPPSVSTRRHWLVGGARPILTCHMASPTGAPLYLTTRALSYRATSPRVFGGVTHRLIMDYIVIPNFALLRHVTMIVRLKTEVTSSCCQPQVHPVKGCSNVVHRLSSCEQCIRTRLNKKYSDCDSELVDNTLPYKTRAAKSRYVNACAAVCLLLLVGGLTPQSSAAPPRSRRMASQEENPLWGNPCDYNESDIKSKLKYEPSLAGKVVAQASNTLSKAKAYKNEVASLHDFSNFEDLLGEWNTTHWLRARPWHIPEVLPPEKEYGTEVDDDYLTNLMNDIDKTLPTMGKSLKLLVAGLRKIGEYQLVDNNIADDSLQRNFTNTSSNVRAVLCYFSDVMRARELEMPKLLDSDIPEFKYKDRLTNALLVYRDTINYLEYITQVFDKMNQTLNE